MIAILTLHAGSPSDVQLKDRCGPCVEPFSVGWRDGSRVVEGTATHLARGVGRKHGKTVRYWVTITRSISIGVD